jgi:glucokinase
MILAGDIGGTNTRLGLFEPSHPRPRRVRLRVFPTLDFPNLGSIISAFFEVESIDRTTVDRACFGVAGPVLDEAAQLTNVPWRVEARGVAATFGIARVRLLNDLQAMAYSVQVLEDAELHTLQRGAVVAGGNRCLIAAGTGLGIALLHSVDDRFIPSPSEGGHADFAARTDREIALLRDLTARFGRAEVEHVVSGPGLTHIHRIAHIEHKAPCTAAIDLGDEHAPAAITKAALERKCEGCVETLDMFVDAYGAATGNLALAMVATGGVYIGGGIAPKILPALEAGSFLRAFSAKAPFAAMLQQMPVRVILNPDAGLLGAAVFGAVM